MSVKQNLTLPSPSNKTRFGGNFKKGFSNNNITVNSRPNNAGSNEGINVNSRPYNAGSNEGINVNSRPYNAGSNEGINVNSRPYNAGSNKGIKLKNGQNLLKPSKNEITTLKTNITKSKKNNTLTMQTSNTQKPFGVHTSKQQYSQIEFDNDVIIMQTPPSKPVDINAMIMENIAKKVQKNIELMSKPMLRISTNSQDLDYMDCY
jgi:monoamine oxidase